MPIGLEVDSGPWELRRGGNSPEDRVGFAWYESGSGAQQSFFILKDEETFPLPYGKEVIFRPHKMSGVTDADSFRDWVDANGELGENRSFWRSEESFEPWSAS